MLSVKNVLKTVSSLLTMSEMVDYFNGENDEGFDKQILDDLVMAINMAVGNVAANYISVNDKKTVNIKDGYVLFSDITDRPIIQIKKVKSGTVSKKFRVHNDGIELENGEYEIIYSYFPDMLTLDDNIDYFPSLSEMLLAYAVAAEYLFLKGQIDDAYVWDKRFKASLLSLQRPARNIIIPKRRWW